MAEMTDSERRAYNAIKEAALRFVAITDKLIEEDEDSRA